MKRLILTFQDTHQAIDFESYCQQRSIQGRLIPLPQEIQAGCGLGWRCSIEQKEELEKEKDSGHIHFDRMIEVS